MAADILLYDADIVPVGKDQAQHLDDMPKDSRIALFPNYNRYSSPESTLALKKYLAIAQKHGLTVAQLSLAFVNQLPFVTSNIIGATKMSQLKENIDSINIDLSEEIINEINVMIIKRIFFIIFIF